jgi:hypothetical protein
MIRSNKNTLRNIFIKNRGKRDARRPKKSNTGRLFIA